MGAGRYGLIFVVSKTFFFVRKRGTVSWAFLLRMTFFFSPRSNDFLVQQPH